MKFSTQTLRAIENLLAEDFQKQLTRQALSPDEIEQALRDGLQEVGQNSYGELLSLLDEHRYQVEEGCACQQVGKRVSRRAAQVLTVFGRAQYKGSYYHCGSCGRRWVPLDERPTPASRPSHPVDERPVRDGRSECRL